VLILERLLAGLKDACGAFPGKRRGVGRHTMADIGLSAFSLSFMQSESFLFDQRALEEGRKTSNCHSLFVPEFIVRPDDAEKQDCDRNAAKRWLAAHGERMKELRPVYLATIFSLANRFARPFWRGGDFLFTAKPDSHVALFDFMNGAQRDEMSVLRKEGGK
jgi:hypothetical protein